MKETFELNTEACSVNDLKPKCNELWTLGQQVAIRRLSVKTRVEYKKPARYELINDFSVRAARIAGNYAKIYLEQEEHGKPAQKGRFYWTGLAAFASKQVMCALDYTTHTKMRAVPMMDLSLDLSKQFLGMGNFWLFQDIFVWHWFYINYPENFFDCLKKRNFKKYIDDFQSTFSKLPWARTALPKINNLEFTDYLVQGFELIRKTEMTTTTEQRLKLQLASLMAIANHEQLKILQPLIYDDTVFRRLLDAQALMEGNMGIPRRLAAFSTQCETGDQQKDVVMTKGNLYDPTDRMKFITNIAITYHNLMQKMPAQMGQTISTIATWSERGY